MSESDQVRRLREGYDAYNRGDFDAVLALLDPDIELKPPEGSITGEELRGAEAVRAWMEPDIFESIRTDVHAVHENGDRILLETTSHAVVAGGGMELHPTSYHVWTMRDGRGVRLELWLDREPALEAAGLPGS